MSSASAPPPSNPKPNPHVKVRRKLNLKSLAVLGIALAVALPAAGIVWYFMRDAGKVDLLRQAQASFRKKDYLSSYQYVTSYLEWAPQDLEALDLKSSLLALDATAQEAAVKAGEQVLRFDPKRIETRRRLVESYLRLGQPRSAEVHALELLRQGVNDAEMHRLLAQAYYVQSAPGDQRAYLKVADELIKSRELDPKDVKTISSLAELYQTDLKDPQKAVATLDAALAKFPNDYHVLMMRYYFFARHGQLRKASRELDRAFKLAPGEIEVLLAASRDALEQGDLALARQRIDAIPRSELDSPLVRREIGRVDSAYGNPNKAIESWREGLKLARGGDADLTGKLAEILLRLGRVADADPLIAQFRRLTGGKTPSSEARYLFALRSLATNRPAQAIEELTAIRRDVSKPLEPAVLETLGIARDQIGDRAGAIESFQAAVASEPGRIQTWLLLARLQGQDSRDDAIRTLNSALSLNQDNPRAVAIEVELARQRSVAQASTANIAVRAPASREQLDALIQRLQGSAPANPQLILVEADDLAMRGKLTNAVALLEKGTEHHPAVVGLWTALSQGYGAMGMTDRALAALAKATAAAGDHIELRLAKARLLVLAGNDRAAHDALVKFADRDVLNPADRAYLEAHPEKYLSLIEQTKLWEGVGNYYLQKSDYVSAREALEQWARLSPDELTPKAQLFNLALVEGEKERMDKAVAALEPKGPQPKLPWLKARIEAKLRRPKGDKLDLSVEADRKSELQRLEQAKPLIDELQKKLPENPEGTLQLAAWLSLKADVVATAGTSTSLAEADALRDQAIEQYREALGMKSAGRALGPLIDLLTRRQRFAEVDQLRSRQTEVSDSDLSRLSVVSSLRINNRERAQQLAAEVIRGNPESFNLRLWQSRLLTSMGKAEDAEKSLREYAEQHPKSAPAWESLLLLQAGLDHLDDARATLERMRLQVETDRPELLWAQGYRMVNDRVKADDFFKQAIDKWPNDLQVRRTAADYYLQTNRFDQAAEILRPVLALKPAPDWARRMLALVLCARVDSETAWNESLSLIGPDPKSDDTPDDRLVRAQVYARGQSPERTQKAIAILEKLAADYPDAEFYRVNLVKLYDVNKQLDKARAEAERLAKNNKPDDVAGLVSILLETKDDTAAADAVARLAKLDPQNPRTLELQARVLHAQKADDQAIALLKKGYQTHSKTDRGELFARLVVKLLAEFGHLEAAEQISADSSKRWPSVACDLANALGDKNRVDEAFRLLTSTSDGGGARQAALSAYMIAVRQRPVSPAQLKTVDALITKAVAAEPNSIELLLAQAMIRAFQERHQDTVDTYAKVLAIDPTNVTALNDMAWALSEDLDQPQKGLDTIEKAIHYYGRNPSLLDTRGMIYLRMKKYDEALADLKASARLFPRGNAYFHLARLYQAINKPPEVAANLAKMHEQGITHDQLLSNERKALDALEKTNQR